MFSLTGLGRKDENGRSFSVALAMTLESDDERYAWANEALCVAEARVVGRRVRCTFTACSPRATRIRSDPRRTPIAITTESPTGLTA